PTHGRRSSQGHGLEHGPHTGQASVLQVLEGLQGPVEGVGASTLPHPAPCGQDHEFLQVVVAAHQVADHVDLTRDHVDRGHVQGTAVADDEVASCVTGHGDALLLGTALTHEVQDHVRALAVGGVEDLRHLVAVGTHRVSGAELLGHGERLGGAVHYREVGRTQFFQGLDTAVPQTTRTDDDHVRTRVQERDGLADGVVGGQARVGQCRHIHRCQGLLEHDAGSRVGTQVRGHAPVAVDPGKGRVLAVHVVARPAGAAESARDQGVQDHPVPDVDVAHRGADLHDGARVLVPEHVRKPYPALVGPLPLDDVQIGPAHPGRVHLDQHVQGTFDPGIGNLVDRWWALVLVYAYGTHHASSGRPSPLLPRE